MSRNILHYFGSSASKTEKNKSADISAQDGRESRDSETGKNAVRVKDKSKRKQMTVQERDRNEDVVEHSEEVLELFPKERDSVGIHQYFTKLARPNVNVEDLEPAPEKEVADTGEVRPEVRKTYRNKRKRRTRDTSKLVEDDVVCLSPNDNSDSTDEPISARIESPSIDSNAKGTVSDSSPQNLRQRKNWNLRIKLHAGSGDDEKDIASVSEEGKDEAVEESRPRRSCRIRSKRVEIVDDNTREEAEPVKTKGRRQRRESSDEEIEVLDSSKVAPIFLKRSKVKEMRIVNKATLEFLHSGIPEALKQQIETQAAVDSREVEIFPRVSHVIQSDESPLWKLQFPENFTKLLKNPEFGDFRPDVQKLQFGLGLCMKQPVLNPKKKEESDNLNLPLSWKTCKQLIQSVKLQNDYPYFRTLRTLLKRKSSLLDSGEADTAWTDVYQPKSSAEVLGDRRTLSQLKQWLHRWKPVLRTESSRENGKRSKKSTKKNKRARIDSHSSEAESDFESCEDFVSLASEEDENHVCNSILLTGPTGGGKTAVVYALALELGFTVLEINASSRRGSKLVLSQLQEATQSHSLGNPGVTNKFFGTGSKETGCSGPTGLALILFEDVDLILEAEDETFHSAVSTILASSKRPIVMTATTSTSGTDHTVHVLHEKIRGRFEVLGWTRPSVSSACSYLWTLCLAEGCYLEFSSLKTFLQQGSSGDTIDLRSAILQLQFLLSRHCYQRKLAFNQLDVKDSAAGDTGLVKEVALTRTGSGCSNGKEVMQPVELPRALTGDRPCLSRPAKKLRYVYSPKENTVEIAQGQVKRFSRIHFLDDSLYEADSNDAAGDNSKIEETAENSGTVVPSSVPGTGIAVVELTSRLLDSVALSDNLVAACSSLNPDFIPCTNRVSGVEDASPEFSVLLSWNSAEIQREIQSAIGGSAQRLLEKVEFYSLNDSVYERPLDVMDFLPLSTSLRSSVLGTDYQPAVRFYCRVALGRWVEKQKKKRSSHKVNSSKVLVHPFDLLVDVDSLVSLGNQF